MKTKEEFDKNPNEATLGGHFIIGEEEFHIKIEEED